MKVDRIFPDDWKGVIQGKKVIFYNTSVGSMLAGREKHIQKMKWVFQTFHEHPEVALWWRPHPLELSTIRSMIPNLEEQYREMRRQYQEVGVGILDESTDLYRAIAVSDAYYGDWSSVVQLFRAANKPVLYENDTILDRNKELFYNIVDFVFVDRYVWFLSLTMNILFAMNLDTFEIVEIIKIPYGRVLGKYVSYRIARVENYLVLIPGCGKWIIRFDMNEKKFDKLEIGNYTVSIKFGAYAIYNDYIYMLPAFENRILKYDVIHNEIICVKEIGKKKNTLFLELNIDISASYIYAVESETNFIYKYNMLDDTYEKKQIHGEDIRLSGIKKLNDLFILILANKNEILLWNENENQAWKLNGIPKEYPAKCRPFGDFIEYKEDVYFFPEQAGSVYKLNTVQMVLEQYLEIEKKGDGEGEIYFRRAKSIGDGIWAYDCLHNQWISVKPEDNIVNKHSIVIQDEMLDKIASYSMFDKDENSDMQVEVWEEDKAFYSLHNYIKDVVRRNAIEQNIEQKESIGKNIYKTIAADIYI